MKLMTKKCGNCGFDVAEGQIYCERCKELVDVDSIIMAKHESEEEYLEDVNEPLTNREKIEIAVERANELEEFVTKHKAGGAFEHSPEELEKKKTHEKEERLFKKKELKKWILIFTIIILGGLGIAYSLKDRYSRLDSICSPQFFNEMVYYANTADNNRLYRMKADGTEKQLLTKLSIDSFAIYKNKDGTEDLYYSAPGFGIYKRDREGKQTLLIETSAQYIYPVENGFYYIPDFNGERCLSFYRYETGSIRKLTTKYGDEMVYTPEGILYREKSAEGNIWLNADGIDIRILPKGVNAFKLSENKLIFAMADENSNVYSLAYKAGDQLRLKDSTLLIRENVNSFEFSDGWIYYLKGSKGNLYRCRGDGTETTQLTKAPISHFAVYKGKVIGYMKSRLVLLDANTKMIVKLD